VKWRRRIGENSQTFLRKKRNQKKGQLLRDEDAVSGSLERRLEWKQKHPVPLGRKKSQGKLRASAELKRRGPNGG